MYIGVNIPWKWRSKGLHWLDSLLAWQVMTGNSNVAQLYSKDRWFEMIMEFIILYTSMLFCFVNTHQYVNHNLQNEQCYQRQDERILSRRHLGTEKGNPSYSSNLKLAAFNVQTFGRRKMNSPGVPTILVKVGCDISWNSYNQDFLSLQSNF